MPRKIVHAPDVPVELYGIAAFHLVFGLITKLHQTGKIDALERIDIFDTVAQQFRAAGTEHGASLAKFLQEHATDG